MDIVKLSAFEMKQKLHDKKISSRELVEAHFDLIENREEKLNSFISLNKEEALKSADKVDKKIKNGERLGLLGGLPIGVKDNILTKNLRTTGGSKILEDFIPPYDASVIKRIKEADGIIIGKTNMDEFGMGTSTEASAYGPTRNPVDIERVPGGSSGGSAASVSGKEAALAIGTDTGGSVRQPASFTGIVGIKPSYGIVSRYGVISMANTLDQVGAFGRDIKDAVLMLSSITGYDEKDSTSFNNPEGTIPFLSFPNKIDKNYLKDMKIGLPMEFFGDGIDKGIREEIDKAIKVFESLGAEVEEISLPYIKYSLAAYYIISSSEISSNMSRFDGIRYGYRAEEYENLDELYINTRTEGLGPEVKKRIILGNYSLKADNIEDYYKKALKVRTLIIEDFKKAFKKYDVILSPTNPFLPFKIGEKIEDPFMTDLYLAPASLAGICAMSIPCGYSQGLPVGLQLMGDKFQEAKIIKAGLGYEGGKEIGL